jgi:Family of unknown function (DUF5372)
MSSNSYMPPPVKMVQIPKPGGKGSGFLEFRRASHSAQSSRQRSGWLLVTYPFHPLAGRTVEILYSKRRGGGRVFVCDAGDGSSMTLPVEWTDRAPTPDNARLSAETLSDLRVVVDALLRRCPGPPGGE